MPSTQTSSRRAHCTKFLSYDPPETAREVLLRLAEYAGDAPVDQSGTGELIDKLENRLRELLGKEAVLFMPSGKAAQNIMLRLWCDSRGDRRVAMHPRCHLQEWEGNAYAHLFGLESVCIGSPDRQISPREIEALDEKIGAVTLELALRPLGCQVMPYDELVRVRDICRAKGIPLHGDCARIWESQPYYGRPISEIAGFFDSLYVSLYKGIGGLAGAAIAGPTDLIESARVWQLRMGQKLYRQFPYVLAALQGLEKRLAKMSEFHAKAVQLASTFQNFEGIATEPAEPHTNAFLVHFPYGNGRHSEGRDLVAQETGLWLFDYMPSGRPDSGAFEVHIWEGGLQISTVELRTAMSIFLQHIEAYSASAKDQHSELKSV
jgi:threonine aldolase